MNSKLIFPHFISNLKKKLSENRDNHFTYFVPALWLPNKLKITKFHYKNVNPFLFFIEHIDEIYQKSPQKIERTVGGEWSKHAVIYNMFIRAATAFDHDNNGKLDYPLNSGGWRETGTFLKATAMLHYIKSLGANTIHLLPITVIGSDGKKGSLGSPYSIKNPILIDPSLHEPNIGVTSNEEFRLFVESAHHLGMRVVLEFVFRTASRDSDWIKEHPDWFYWIKENIRDRKIGSRKRSEYGNPVFTRDELKKIINDTERNDFTSLIPPHKSYTDMFTQPPAKENIIMNNGRYIGILEDGIRVRVPGAFSDWPPNDIQPPWSDVTYLKLYNHPDFNYIAYNTLRMYDTRLAKSENINQTLWGAIVRIIPHYQLNYNIDGVMIDMGHALPIDLKLEIIGVARKINPDFAFWDENFSVNMQSAHEGYNLVIGYQWCDQHKPDKFRNLLKRFSTEGFPLPFFATPESHNTPRAAVRTGQTTYSKYAWTLSNFIPAVPFIHSGFELGEIQPINTGLDFSKSELLKYFLENLPLFSEYAFEWVDKNNLIDFMRKVSSIRREFESLIIDSSPVSFCLLNTHSSKILAFVRTHSECSLLIIANSDMKNSHRVCLEISTKRNVLKDILSGGKYIIRFQKLRADLCKGEVLVFKL